jgi:hypothetical protein
VYGVDHWWMRRERERERESERDREKERKLEPLQRLGSCKNVYSNFCVGD